MKRSLLFILSLITCFSVKASTADTVFYDDLWRFVQNKERCTYYRIIERQTDSLFKATDHYKNDRVVRVGTYTEGGSYLRSAIASKVFATGTHKYYYWKSGLIRSEGEYYLGQKHGHWKTYHDTTGYLLATGTYILGKPDGEWLYYFNSTGSLQGAGVFDLGKKIGHWRYFFPDGSVYFKTEYNRKGEKIKDEIEYYPNGQIYSVEHFGLNGNALNRTMETFYNNGQKEGIFKYEGSAIIKGKCFDVNGNKIPCNIDRTVYSFPHPEYDLEKVLYKNYISPKIMEGQDYYDIIEVSFSIDRSGNIYDVQSLSPETNPYLQADALITISSLPAWKPARVNSRSKEVSKVIRMLYSSDIEEVRDYYYNLPH